MKHRSHYFPKKKSHRLVFIIAAHFCPAPFSPSLQRQVVVHYQPGESVGGAAGSKTCVMFTSHSLMAEVGKHGHFVVTDGKNDTNSAGFILSSFSLRTQYGTPYPAFLWLGEVETEGTILEAGQVFRGLVPCTDAACSHEWSTKVRPDGGFTVCCPCSINSNFSPGSSTDKFLGSVNALVRLGWQPVSLCDFHVFQAIDRQLRITVSFYSHSALHVPIAPMTS